MAPLVLHFGALQWQRRMLKRNVKFEYLKQAENRHLLTYFSFSREEYEALDWEEAHEFKLGTEKYDVIETQSESGKIILWCFRDRAEERVDQEVEIALMALLGTSKSENKEKGKKQQHLKCLLQTTRRVSPSFEDFGLAHFHVELCFYKAPVTGIDSPPPETVS